VPLETISLNVPDAALEAYEAAFGTACDTVGFFRNDVTGEWRIEGVKPVGAREDALAAALVLAGALTGVSAPLARCPTEATGWLARSYAGFPEQRIGRRFVIRGTHLRGPAPPGRVLLTLDAALAFGSGEHGSTRGCLLALEAFARRHPRRLLDLGTGSGILAIAAACLLRRPVLATDIEPWSVRVARRNTRLNRVGPRVGVRLANGWHHPAVRGGGPYDLVFANILARPLCLMARDLARHLAPGGAAVLAGLLGSQVRQVLAAHRRHGLVLARRFAQGNWTTLVVCRRGG
jgi:ribosomal protein L11 methyltransferase